MPNTEHQNRPRTNSDPDHQPWVLEILTDSDPHHVAIPRDGAVLFDMDGTLCDTLPGHFAAMNLALAEYAAPPLTWERFIDECIHQGKKSRELLQALNLTIDPDRWRDCKDQFYAEVCANEITLAPGVAEWIRQLQQSGIPVGIVTAARRQSLNTFLNHCWSLPAPDIVVAFEDVSQSKPYPEPYLRACEQLGRHPSKCIAIEDSPSGVTAARAAGVKCFAIVNGVYGHTELAHADRQISCFTQLQLKELGGTIE